jgi:hypothetical protein
LSDIEGNLRFYDLGSNPAGFEIGVNLTLRYFCTTVELIVEETLSNVIDQDVFNVFNDNLGSLPPNIARGLAN